MHLFLVLAGGSRKWAGVARGTTAFISVTKHRLREARHCLLCSSPTPCACTLRGRCSTTAEPAARADIQARKTRSRFAEEHVDRHRSGRAPLGCGWTKQWCVFKYVCAVDCWQAVYDELVRTKHTPASLMPSSLTTSGCACV